MNPVFNEPNRVSDTLTDDEFLRQFDTLYPNLAGPLLSMRNRFNNLIETLHLMAEAEKQRSIPSKHKCTHCGQPFLLEKPE